MEQFELFIATKNDGKIREIEALLSHLPIKVRNASDFPEIIEPKETGLTFTENATLKAKYYAKKTGLWSLADDSGLEIEALDGKPGVFSARYAGKHATNSQKIAKILEELKQTKKSARSARFVCSMALADENAKVRILAEGVCDGRIAFEPKGNNGFGYDPIFVPEGFTQTFGELPDEIKRKMSHRGKAIDKIILYLGRFVAP